MFFLKNVTEFKRTQGARDKRKRRPRKHPPIKNKNGGLTRYGINYYNKKYGSNLKMGVKTKGKDMSLEDMRRKGSWAVRHMQSARYPMMKNGEYTRASSQARAWGERPPRNHAEARAIAAKGRRLLERYKRLKKNSQ